MQQKRLQHVSKSISHFKHIAIGRIDTERDWVIIGIGYSPRIAKENRFLVLRIGCRPLASVCIIIFFLEVLPWFLAQIKKYLYLCKWIGLKFAIRRTHTIRSVRHLLVEHFYFFTCCKCVWLWDMGTSCTSYHIRGTKAIKGRNESKASLPSLWQASTYKHRVIVK